MPIISTRGVASAKALGLASGLGATYIEDVFSAYTYTGTGAARTITNGIDLAGKGGLVWGKSRSHITDGHHLTDTVRGTQYYLKSETSAAQVDATTAAMVQSVSSTGYTLGASSYMNDSAKTYASWTFRKQPKFFDVVTYTGDGTANRTVAHSLGSAVGCVIIKKTSNVSDWEVWHRADGTTPVNLALNDTRATYTSFPANFVSANMTATTIGLAVNSGGGNTNASGDTYVAYLFAHNAGGFGLTGTDNVISCGSYSGTSAAGNFVNLGFEPQFLMVKEATVAGGGWFMVDASRGVPTGGNDSYLSANASDAEASPLDLFTFRATGFAAEYSGGSTNTSGRTYIYIAIRRGPMKVPTTGTSVFAPVLGTAAATIPTFVTNFPVDLGFYHSKASTFNWFLTSRLQGGGTLNTNITSVEAVPDPNYTFDSNTGWGKNFDSDKASFNFRRAPGFFDEVCYTGNGPGTQIISHNLGVAPELSIFKARNGVGGWTVYNGATQFLRLNETNAGATDGNISPTTTNVTVSSSLGFGFNASGVTYVSYLFATCPGVSKVGSYTGNGTTQTINCGFATGAQFILIKRTDLAGDWYVWDSARGIVAGNDPHLSLNTTAAEVTTDDSVDTDSSGFIVNQLAATNINVSAATYIFLAIS